MSTPASQYCYVSSNSANIRVRLIDEPLVLAKSMAERWGVQLLRANGAVALRLTPLRKGGAVLADYKPGGCDITIRRPEDVPTFGPTPVSVTAADDGTHLVVRTEGDLAPATAYRRGVMSPSSVVYKSPPKSIDQLILEMTSAREVINAAKKALGDDLDMKIDEAGELRITYVRVL